MEKQLFFQKLFNIIEFTICVLFFIKLTTSCFYFKIKRKAKCTPQFWMYLFFSISMICYILCHICTANPLIQEKIQGNLNPMSIKYFQNIFYTGSLVYLQIYIYKMITFADTGNVYIKGTRKKRMQLTRLQYVIYISSIAIILIQVIMIGMVPYFFMSARVSPEILSTICILISLITLIWFLIDMKLFGKIIKKWIWYEIFSLLILPLSYVLNLLELPLMFMPNGFVISIILRAPFLALRILQFGALFWSLFTFKDIRMLYD